MRIRGSGTGDGYGGNWSRSDSFRKKHRLGKKVRGVLLKNLPDNMAWVEIDGDRLLAQLEVAHPEGARLTFVVEQLSPHIVLKELKGKGQGGGTSAVLGRANAFDAARALFEAKFIPLARNSELIRQKLMAVDFFTLLAGEPELYTRYADAARCALALTGSLAQGRGRFLYQPWLIPETRRQVTFINRSEDTGFTEIIVEFDHQKMGMVRTEVLHKDGRTISKLKLQHMSRSKSLQHFLSTRSHPDLACDLAPPAIAKLPQRSHGGIIAERLFKA